jgi:HPt (histidine-containing phosphotransfer) domain-containing protein
MFDKDALLNSFGGDFDILNEIVKEFAKASPGYLEELNEAFAAKDSKKMELVSHTIKGLCATFCCEKARDVALTIETGSKSNNMENMDSLIPELSDLVAALTKELEAFCQESGS